MKQLPLALILLLAATGSIYAHSEFLRSDPANGTTLKQPPNEIRIWFSEPLKIGLSTVEVHDASGREVDARNLRGDEKTPGLVHLSLQPLSTGTYKVNWIAVATDLHTTRGSFSFRVVP